MLPPELSAIHDPEERAMEYTQYRQFFDIWEGLETIEDVKAKASSQTTRDAHLQWLNDCKVRFQFRRLKD